MLFVLQKELSFGGVKMVFCVNGRSLPNVTSFLKLIAAIRPKNSIIAKNLENGTQNVTLASK